MQRLSRPYVDSQLEIIDLPTNFVQKKTQISANDALQMKRCNNKPYTWNSICLLLETFTNQVKIQSNNNSV